MVHIMNVMINEITNMFLILIVLTSLIRYTLAWPSTVYGTAVDVGGGRGDGGGLMYIENDLQCLAQMPVADLMRIRNAIKMMHAVSAYDEHRHHNTSPTMRIETTGQNQSDTLLRALDEPTDETRQVFQYFKQRFKGSTTKSPLAEAYIMTSQGPNTGKIHQLV